MSRGNNYCSKRDRGGATLEDLTSSAQNSELLRMLRDDDSTLCQLDIVGEADELDDDVAEEEEEQRDFVVRENDHLGWLGYFLGENRRLNSLFIDLMSQGQMKMLMKGVKHNRSIQNFAITNSDYNGQFLAHFVEHNSNLKSLRLCNLPIGLQFAQSFAKALITSEEKSLTELSLKENKLSNEAVKLIVAALSEYHQLKTLHISEDLDWRDKEYYDILAQSITLESITSSKKNAKILRELRDNTWNEKVHLSLGDYDLDEAGYFSVDEDDDLGWLAYFLGNSKQVKRLDLCFQPAEDDEIDALLEGISHNQSIERLDVCHCDIDFNSLSPFIINNSNLNFLEFWQVSLGPECAHSLALALDKRQDKSLTHFHLSNNNLSNESFEEIAASLRSYTQLESLGLIGIEGGFSLKAIIGMASFPLKWLALCSSNLDDVSLSILASAMTSNTTLGHFDLSNNQLITAEGLKSLASLLSSACPIETLFLKKMNIGDDGAEALAYGLMNNTSLKNLVISPRSAGISRTGWSAFSKLLCDTSSINNTYLSNHTLKHIGDDYYYEWVPNANFGSKIFRSGENCYRDIPPDIAEYLKTNKSCDSHKHVARFKIDRYHPDMPIEPLFEYELKLLPLLACWFPRYAQGHNKDRIKRYFQKRELSAVYKFLRGVMPKLAEGNRSICCGRKRKFEG